MTIINRWTLAVLQSLHESQCLRKIAREGFLAKGRGALIVDLELVDDNCITYLSAKEWETFGLAEPQKISCLETIASYQPLTETVVVAISPLDGKKFEVTVCLIG